MKGKRKIFSLVAILAIAVVSFFFVARTIWAASNLNSSVTVGVAVPTISSVTITPSAPIVLTTNTTTPITVTAIIADNNGCSALDNGTRTIELYRTSLGAACGANNQNCYTASAFTATSSCSGGTSENVTTTFNVYYFAQATDASSSFPADSWQATVSVTSNANTTSTANSATTSLQTLTAINITTSSINYGTLSASSTSGSTNQTTTIANAGNSSTTLNLSGTAFVSGSNNFATSSQHYATTSFSYGGNEQALSGAATAVSGFLLTAPTSTNTVASTIFWGVSIPAATASGTYTATTTFASVFHS